VLEQIVSKTNLPAWMLGIYWSTTERMATLEVEAALQDAKVRQLAMLPELIRLFSVFLRLRGRTWKSVTTSPDKPGDWGIVFETPNLRDMVAQAQARFLNAQADQMQSTAGEREAITVNPPKKAAKGCGPGCGCGHHFAGAGKMIHGAKELHRPEPWPELDAVETGYEDRLKADWEDLRGRIYTIAKLTDTDLAAGVRSAKGPEDAFTFDALQRARALDALKDFIGEYAPAAEGSPVVWYYGQAYSLGLIQAARMVGEARPILDLIKNKEIFDELVKNGFELVKNGATKTIQNKILAEMEAHAIAGSNPMVVAARLKKLFSDQNASWERLARTEMSMAAEKAKLDEWSAWEVERVEFTPAPDACPICVALAGDYPLASCPVPGQDTHPRCRCSIRPAASEA
jgi:hypothetical protein